MIPITPMRCFVCAEEELVHGWPGDSTAPWVCRGCAGHLVAAEEPASERPWSPWLVTAMVLCAPFLLLAAASAVGMASVGLTVYGMSRALGSWRKR